MLKVTEDLLATSRQGLQAVQEVLPHTVAQQILEALHDLLKHEPTVVDVGVQVPCFKPVMEAYDLSKLHAGGSSSTRDSGCSGW